MIAALAWLTASFPAEFKADVVAKIYAALARALLQCKHRVEYYINKYVQFRFKFITMRAGCFKLQWLAYYNFLVTQTRCALNIVIEKYHVVKNQDSNMFRLLQDRHCNSQVVLKNYYLEIGKQVNLYAT